MDTSVSLTGQSIYQKVESKKAPENPAEVAISESYESQVRGYSVGNRNAQDGQGLISVADGALSSINDYLQRIRELGVKASNSAIYSSSDMKIMQKEVDQLKQGITDIAKNTQFNTKNLLDGSYASFELATNPSGGGLKIWTTDATLESLGIADFDLTGDFDLKTIDKAINKVSKARASLGASSSALEHTMSANSITSQNTLSAASDLEDTDIQKYVSDKKHDEVMAKYQYFLEKKQQESGENFVDKMLSK